MQPHDLCPPLPTSDRCVFYDEYADGSTCQGDIVQDWVRIGNLAAEALFGCELASSGNIFMEDSDGIFGLGLGQASVFTQMVDAQVIDNEVRAEGRQTTVAAFATLVSFAAVPER